MLTAIGTRAGFVFGGTSVPIAICIWLFLPETSGRAIAEIDELFEKHVPAWRWKKTTTDVQANRQALGA